MITRWFFRSVSFYAQSINRLCHPPTPPPPPKKKRNDKNLIPTRHEFPINIQIHRAPASQKIAMQNVSVRQFIKVEPMRKYIINCFPLSILQCQIFLTFLFLFDNCKSPVLMTCLAVYKTTCMHVINMQLSRKFSDNY